MLEVLVTILILAVGVLSLAALQILAIKNISLNNDASGAAFQAQRKIEELRNTGFTGIVGGTETLSKAAGQPINGVMTWTVTTLPVGAVFPNRYNDVVLDVCWACTTACGVCDSSCTTCKKIELHTMISE
jgi:type II secretory pathway pseudopilin PulG